MFVPLLRRRTFMSKTALVFCLAAAMGLVTAGCGDDCDEAEEACVACGNDPAECADQVDSCRRVGGPAGDDCCELLLDTWERCN
jgi:hypothetical protein